MKLSSLPTMLLLGLSFANASFKQEGQARLRKRQALKLRLEQLGSMGKSLLQALDKVSSFSFWGATSVVGVSMVAASALALQSPAGVQALPLVLAVSGIVSTLVSFFVFGRRADAHQAQVQNLVDSMVRVPR